MFRGLGRESDFVQWLFPTLRTRRKLRDILKVSDKALQSLEKYDAQIGTGERIHMGGTALTAIGSVGIPIGSVIMFYGGLLALESPEEGRTLLDTGYRIGIASVLIWATGRIGQIVSQIVMSRAFSHLHDALDYFNAEQAQQSRKTGS